MNLLVHSGLLSRSNCRPPGQHQTHHRRLGQATAGTGCSAGPLGTAKRARAPPAIADHNREANTSAASSSAGATRPGRSSAPTVEARHDRLHSIPLDDIRIRSGGTGRTVEAYAAIFDEPAEIVDADGHYYEQSTTRPRSPAPSQHRQDGFPVVYNHGMTIAGTPSDRGSVPIGVSKEVRVDTRGVLTVSEYGNSELADEVLEAIRMGAVKAQSYGGRFIRSDPRVPRGGFRPGLDGKLRTVTRLEIAMREFGPTPFPAFAGAAITGVRAQQVLGALLTAPAERRQALLDQLDHLATPLDEVDPDHVDAELGTDEAPDSVEPVTDNDPAPATPLGPSAYAYPRCAYRPRME
jgi:phage head maturation protease